MPVRRKVIMRPDSNARAPFLALTLAAVTLTAVSACSSSSSGGANPELTTRAVSSETFHNVTPEANHIIQRSLALMRGVASNTYQAGELIVSFRSTADKLDQHNVENIVHQAQQQAAAPAKASTSPTPRATRS
jgi:hypothetical protein